MPLAPNSGIGYGSEELDIKGSGYEQFSEVFARFQLPPDSSAVRFPYFMLHQLRLTK